MITHTHTRSRNLSRQHATLTPSGRALMALYSAIKKAIILFKGIYHFRGGRGVSTLGFSKRGRVQSIQSIPKVSMAFHQTGKSCSHTAGLSFLVGRCKSMCVRGNVQWNGPNRTAVVGSYLNAFRVALKDPAV